MSNGWQESKGVAARHPMREVRGLVLVEIALALLVVVLAASLVFILAGRIQQRRKCDRCARDLRAFATVFDDYYQRHKTWPPSSDADSALPPEIEAALKDTNWTKGSPFGGNYGWMAPEPDRTAADAAPSPDRTGPGAITLTAFSPSFPLTLSQSDLLYIDHQIDDGDLATGRFRTGFNGWPVYLVEAVTR